MKMNIQDNDDEINIPLKEYKEEETILIISAIHGDKKYATRVWITGLMAHELGKKNSMKMIELHANEATKLLIKKIEENY